MTSANVTYYIVKDKDGNKIAEYSQNCLCKNTITEKLKSHTPYKDFTLELCWPDEHEAPHYTQEMSLDDYLGGVKLIWLDEYGDPKVNLEDFERLQQTNKILLGILYEMMPRCDELNCKKFAVTIESDWDGTSHYCSKHKRKNAHEHKKLLMARLLLLNYKKDIK